MSDDAHGATIALRDERGRTVGELMLSTRPRQDQSALVDRSDDPSRLTSEPAVQVREAQEYRYVLSLPGEDAVRLEPAELFDPDGRSGRSGRFSPAEAVGHLHVRAVADDRVLGSSALEVRSAKLQHETDYRQMLRDVSEFAADALLQGFQPAAGAFALSDSVSAELLYRRFALLHARLKDPAFLSAMAHILSRPHQGWERATERRPPSRPLSGGHAVQRALVRGRPRRDWPDPPAGVPLDSLPHTVEISRHETTVDTLPNRVVRFALEDWRAVALTTRDAAATHLSGAPQQRGLEATAEVLERLDEWLAHPLFRTVGALTTFPQGNQVLLKREGYRQLFSAWTLSSAGADLAIELDDPVRISQRNVATMYEYWCFLQLASLVAEVCECPAMTRSLFGSVSGGMALGLKKGRASQLRWKTTIAGRELEVELYFNRTFKASGDRGSGSWSLQMRPDCSVLIRPLTGLPGVAASRMQTWVHFDAKYRVDQSPAGDAELTLSDGVQAVESLGLSKTADLVKMHAYRDAIRYSAGAYVLFPGTESAKFSLDTEALPGIGAFPLRPSDGGPVAGREVLRRFLTDVMAHSASQATRYERTRFWEERVAEETSLIPTPDPPMGSLHAPPADTAVLLVTFDDPRELPAMIESGECALPNGEVDTSAEFLFVCGSGVETPLLLRRVGEWYSGRNPFADVAMCCRIELVGEAPAWVATVAVEALMVAKPPRLISWLQLARAASTSS